MNSQSLWNDPMDSGVEDPWVTNTCHSANQTLSHFIANFKYSDYAMRLDFSRSSSWQG
jgi:hypothetical protein